MRKKTNNSRARKPYKKPLIGLVKLIPEEAVLVGCKFVGALAGVGPAKANCRALTGPTNCSAMGS